MREIRADLHYLDGAPANAARSIRIVLEGVAHHVVARGVNHERIFRNGFDKRRYLKRFAAVAIEEKVLVHAYCLMDNHVHWLVTPTTPDGLARLFRRAHTSWAMFFNRVKERCGHLFQNRFHSTPLGENHYWTALRYIEINPRRAGLVETLEDWEFSSAKAHITEIEDPLIKLVAQVGRQSFTPAQWREFLERTDAERERELVLALPGSRPCGSSEWIRGLEERFKRRLARTSGGKPRNFQQSPAVS